MDSLFIRPPRVTLVNLSTGDEIEAQFNPETLEESVGPNWSKLTIPGFSHEPLQFSHTSNMSWRFDLRFNALDGGGNASLDSILRVRRFLLAACYSRRGQNSVDAGGPPRLLFVWPNMISVTAVIVGLSFKHEQFNKLLQTIAFTAAITLEEFRDARLYSEDVFEQGTVRSSSSSEDASEGTLA